MYPGRIYVYDSADLHRGAMRWKQRPGWRRVECYGSHHTYGDFVFVLTSAVSRKALDSIAGASTTNREHDAMKNGARDEEGLHAVPCPGARGKYNSRLAGMAPAPTT